MTQTMEPKNTLSPRVFHRALCWDRDIMYNDVLNVPVASEATIVGNADDMEVIVVANDLADVEMFSTEAITTIKKWLKDAGLALAKDKTEA